MSVSSISVFQTRADAETSSKVLTTAIDVRSAESLTRWHARTIETLAAGGTPWPLYYLSPIPVDLLMLAALRSMPHGRGVVVRALPRKNQAPRGAVVPALRDRAR